MTAFTEDDLHRLGKLVAERRLELGLGILNAANAAAISKDTWKRVELGLTVRDTSYTDVERALQWAPGSCRAVLEGSEPRLAGAPAEGGEPTATLEPEDIRSAVSTAIIATRGDLTGSEIMEINEKVIAELRRRGLV